MRFVSVIGLEQVVEALLYNKARCATKFVSEKEVIRAVRPCYRGKLPRKTSNLEIVLTHGRPNYKERQFIRRCKKAGEPFPVKKIQLRFSK